MTELRQILELDMPSNGKNVDRAAPILVISGIADQLVIEGCPKIVEEPGAIVGFNDFFMPIIELTS